MVRLMSIVGAVVHSHGIFLSPGYQHGNCREFADILTFDFTLLAWQAVAHLPRAEEVPKLVEIHAWQ